MGEGVVIHISERSTLDANKPTATELENIFRLALYPVSGQARWVGPSVRIVRHIAGTEIITEGAWLLDADSADAVSRVMQELNRLAQDFSRDFSTPGWQRYEEAFHGPVQWWASGEAARTRSRDQAPNVAERSFPFLTENPVGPNTSPILPVAAGIGVFLLLGGALWFGIKVASRERPREVKQLPAPRRQLPASVS